MILVVWVYCVRFCIGLLSYYVFGLILCNFDCVYFNIVCLDWFRFVWFRLVWFGLDWCGLFLFDFVGTIKAKMRCVQFVACWSAGQGKDACAIRCMFVRQPKQLCAVCDSLHFGPPAKQLCSVCVWLKCMCNVIQNVCVLLV